MPQALETDTQAKPLFAYVQTLQEFDLQADDEKLSDHDLWNKLQNQVSESCFWQSYVKENFENISCKTLETLAIDHCFFTQFCIKKLKKYSCIPVFSDSNYQAFAITNPFSLPAFTQSKHKTSLYYLLTLHELTQFFKHIYLQHLPADQALFQLFEQAYDYPASDVHLIKENNGSAVQIRHDGDILNVSYLNQPLDEQVKQIIKLKSNMDIAIQNQAQDGHFVALNLPEARISTLPNQFGDDLAIRFIKHKNQLLNLNQLGFSKQQLPLIKNNLSKANGLILITGPTGSGKTSTAYAALRYIQQQAAKIIVSLEDPIEQNLAGVKQSQVNTKADHGFKQGLRALLRQDTDVMFIGEIRDKESAQIALEAAHTGHLVISTLHTQNTYKTLLRLLSFELDPFQLSQALRLIVSQRLVPGICKQCRDKQGLNWQAKGCIYCDNKGYKNRVLLSETRYFKEAFKTDKASLSKPESLGECLYFLQDAAEKIDQGMIRSELDNVI